MNRNYKVIWNRSLGCFTAVAEYAKSRGKSSSGAVSSSDPTQNDSATGAMRTLYLNAVYSGILMVGIASLIFGIPSQALAASGIGGGEGSGTAISACLPDPLNALPGGNEANSGSGSATTDTGIDLPYNNNIAIGCDSSATNEGAIIADRSNPYYTNNATAAGTVPAADTQSFAPESQSAGSVAIGTGASTSDAFALALGEYAKATNVASVAIGVGSLSTGNTALALGRQSVATGDFAQAMGNVSAAIGERSLANVHWLSGTRQLQQAVAPLLLVQQMGQE